MYLNSDLFSNLIGDILQIAIVFVRSVILKLVCAFLTPVSAAMHYRTLRSCQSNNRQPSNSSFPNQQHYDSPGTDHSRGQDSLMLGILAPQPRDQEAPISPMRLGRGSVGSASVRKTQRVPNAAGGDPSTSL